MVTYGIADPTKGDPIGKFDDPTVQRLFDRLVVEGKDSLKAAAQVGVKVERLDITDLDKALATKPALISPSCSRLCEPAQFNTSRPSSGSPSVARQSVIEFGARQDSTRAAPNLHP